jgi:exonuclease SbcD
LAQKTGNSERIRYSGAPIPIGFAEAGQTKSVVVVRFSDHTPVITEHPVPCFQKLIAISGDVGSASATIEELKTNNTEAWLEIEITSPSAATDITSHFEELIKETGLEILRIKNRTIASLALAPLAENESLDELDDSEVFSRCLDANDITEPEERTILTETYREAIGSMSSEDSNAM